MYMTKLFLLCVISVNIVFSLNDVSSEKRTGEDSTIYQYRIVGYDSIWKNTDIKTREIWSHLPAGNYQFQLRARSADKDKWRNLEIFELQIVPPFWRVWQFWLLVSLFTLVFVYFLRRYEINKRYILKKVMSERMTAIEMERSRIARDFHDGVGTTLSQISILTDVAYQKLNKEDITGAKREINTIASSVRNVVETLRDIIWPLDPTHNTLEDLIANIRHYIGRCLQPQGIKLNFVKEVKNESMVLPSEFRRNIYLIVKEAINNICKHSKASIVDVTISLEGKEFTLEIKDDGIGFSDAQIGKSSRSGNGLRNIQSQTEMINGKVNITSEIVSGTVILIKIPIQNMFTPKNAM